MAREMDITDKIMRVVISRWKKGEYSWITQIARDVGVSPSTVSKYIYILEAKGKIQVIKMGGVKLVKPRVRRWK